MNSRVLWRLGLVLSCALAFGCGPGGEAELLDAGGDEDVSAAGRASCAFSPTPVGAGQAYTVAGSAAKSASLTVDITDAAGTVRLAARSGVNGRYSVTHTSTAAGRVSALVHLVSGDRFVASCAGVVVAGVACGDAVCDVSESCASCAADCGACVDPSDPSQAMFLAWSEPAEGAEVSGVTALRLVGRQLANVEVFRNATFLERCVVAAGGESAECSLDTRQFANGALTLGAHAWNSPAGDNSFTAEADAGALTLRVQNDAAPIVDEARVWLPLTVMAVEDPMAHGAAGDGVSDDFAALASAINALPAGGGIVFVPPGKTFKKRDYLVISKAHVKLWSPNRQGVIYSQVSGVRRKSGFICRGVAGCGFFGLKLTSDAVERFDALEDNQLSTDNASDVEMVGNEITGSPAAGIFIYNASRRSYIEGNYVHHTQADHIHHTDGSRESWVWDNWFFNEAPSNGDDGIACVTYCPTCPKCGDMEWWRNVHLGAVWGRGYSVIGGDNIFVHHNWAIDAPGAGLIVASEPSYNSASSNDLVFEDNWLYRGSLSTSHPSILVSGLNTAAPPITNVAFRRNVVVSARYEAYRVEGSTSNVTNEGMSTSAADFPSAVPTLADVSPRDTSVLATRDTSFVDASARTGLYRIQVRQSPSGSGFEQRFEYVVKGTAAAIAAFAAARRGEGDCVVEQLDLASASYLLVLTAAPVVVPAAVAPVAFTELRSKERTGELTSLWHRLNQRAYACAP